MNNNTNIDLPYIEHENLFELENSKDDSEFKICAQNLNKDGYCILDLNISDQEINGANSDIDILVEKKNFKTNSAAYHYNESPRIVEAWKTSSSIKSISVNKKLNNFLKYAYQSEPIPFSTINFLKGTEQPLHSDEFHFGSIPHRYLTGVWIALEDIHPDSGPLSVAKGSHKLPIFSFEQIGIPIPKSEKEFKVAYTKYEEWAKEMIEANSYKVVTPKINKGECLIWCSNLLHGSYEIKNKSLSRKSLVVHFHYEACRKIFYPSYSNLEKGRFVPRSLKDLDIRKK